MKLVLDIKDDAGIIELFISAANRHEGARLALLHRLGYAIEKSIAQFTQTDDGAAVIVESVEVME